MLSVAELRPSAFLGLFHYLKRAHKAECEDVVMVAVDMAIP